MALQQQSPQPPPALGGLGQASQQKPFDPDTTAAETIETAQQVPDSAARNEDERRKQRLALQANIELLQKQLTSRTNQLFDPMLMRVAAGFAKPTKTGSFGESLGYAAEGAADEAEKQFVRDQANAKLNMELIEKRNQMNKGDAFSDWASKKMGMTPMTGAAAPMAASIKETSGVASGTQLPIGSAQITTPQQASKFGRITAEDLAYAGGNFTKEDYEILKSIAELQRKDLISTPEGMYDAGTGKMEYPFSKAEPVSKFGIPYFPGGEIPVTTDQYAQIKVLDARTKNMPEPERKAAFLKYYSSQGIGGALPSDTSPGGVSGMMTPEEKRTQQATAQKQSELAVESYQKQKDKIYSDSDNSRPMLNNANFVYKFATDPKTQGAFGVLAGGTAGQAIGNLIAQGISTPGGGIKIAGLEDAVRQMTGTPEEIKAAQQVISHYAELELAFRNKYYTGTGGGAISDKEQAVVQKIGGGISDNAQVAASKAELVQARAKLDKAIGDTFYEWEKKNPNKSIQDFKQSGDYKSLTNEFDSHMDKLYNKYYGAPPAAATAPPATGAGKQNRVKVDF
jgi:hypothetical protein